MNVAAARGLSAPFTDLTRAVAGREREVRDILWLLASVTWVLAPLADVVPIWCALGTAGCIIWRAVLTLRGQRLPTRVPLLVLMLVAAGAVVVRYHSIFGKDAGVAYVVLLLGLKLLEMRARRDIFVVVFLSLFIMLTSLFDSQSIGAALWLLGGVLWLVTALLRVSLGRHEPSLWAKLRLAAQIILLALPLMMLTFVFFPRVQGPLWGMPANAFAARTGLSDTMSPGSIDSLVESDELAFVAHFTARVPLPRERYFRGPVLGWFDGRTWRPLSDGLHDADSGGLAVDAASAVDYTVTMQPSHQNAVYLLDAPTNAPRVAGYGALLRPDLQVRLGKSIGEVVRFEARSYTGFHYGLALSARERQRWLQLPETPNPRTRQFALALRGRASDDLDYVRRVLTMIRTENFFYTTTPPDLGANPVDEFLFDTRRGFCEHYASAFVVLLRAAGIPARVVTGYQGGDLNPLNGDLSVRQRDAHAWAEAWLPGVGWSRFDPTAAVAPQRIEQGFELSTASQTGLVGAIGNFGQDWLRWGRYRLEALNSAWNRWIVAYGDSTQKRMFANWGMPDIDWQGLTVALIGSCGLLLAIFGAQIIVRRPRAEPVVALYARLCETLAGRGARRRPSEGPRDYLARVRPMLDPADAVLAEQAFAHYEALRYAPGPVPAATLKSFRSCVAALRA